MPILHPNTLRWKVSGEEHWLRCQNCMIKIETYPWLLGRRGKAMEDPELCHRLVLWRTGWENRTLLIFRAIIFFLLYIIPVPRFYSTIPHHLPLGSRLSLSKNHGPLDSDISNYLVKCFNTQVSQNQQRLKEMTSVPKESLTPREFISRLVNMGWHFFPSIGWNHLFFTVVYRFGIFGKEISSQIIK